MATEKKAKSILYDEHSINKVEMITKSIGMVYSGMGPDYRQVMGVMVIVKNTIRELCIGIGDK